MPKISQDNKEMTENQLTTALGQVLIQSAQTPTVVCGVNRKVNIGHFETIDVYMGVSLPIINAELLDFDVLRKQITDTATEAFAIAAQETGDRYLLIKDSIKDGRQKSEEA